MKLPQRHAMALAMATLSSSLAFADDTCSVSNECLGIGATPPEGPMRLAQVNNGNAAAPAAPVALDPVLVARKRLDAARNELSPETGSTVYRSDQKDIQALPLGDATPLNQVSLQAPGFAQDSYGQLQVRGDHSNLQYRINGVTIPKAISGFGQALDTRFDEQINVLTGAVPSCVTAAGSESARRNTVRVAASTAV